MTDLRCLNPVISLGSGKDLSNWLLYRLAILILLSKSAPGKCVVSVFFIWSNCGIVEYFEPQAEQVWDFMNAVLASFDAVCFHCPKIFITYTNQKIHL